MRNIRTLRILLSCIATACLLAFMYFVNYKTETLQPTEFVSSAGLYLIFFVAFVLILGEAYGFLKKLEDKNNLLALGSNMDEILSGRFEEHVSKLENYQYLTEEQKNYTRMIFIKNILF